MTKSLTITAPDDVFDQATLAICSQFAYRDTIDDGFGNPIPNPESRTDFAARMVLRFIRDNVVADAVKSANAAVIAARTEANAAMDQAATAVTAAVS